MISGILTLLFILLSVTGCEKMSDEELLTSHVWKWDRMTTTSTDENVLVIMAFANAIMTGATFEFLENGTYNLTATNYTDSGTWELIDDDTVLMDTDEMTIVKLTKDELVLEGIEVDDELGAYSVTMYLKK